MSDAWDEAVDPVDEGKPGTSETPMKPRPIRRRPGAGEVGHRARGRAAPGTRLHGDAGRSLSTTLRSLANRFGVPELQR